MPTREEWQTIYETLKNVRKEMCNVGKGKENELKMMEFVALFGTGMNHGSHLQTERRWMTNDRLSKKDLTQCKNAHYWMKFASAAYGWAGLIGQGLIAEDAAKEGDFKVGIADKDAIAYHCKLKVDDVVFVSKGNMGIGTTLKYPCHSVVIDRRTKSVVIAIRGTMSITDAVVDALFDRIPFQEIHPKMFGHKGILSGGREMYTRLMPTLKDLFEKREKELNGFKIVVTGHSLGGGSTYTLGMLMMAARDDASSSWPLPRDIHIELWAYAPPPMVSDLTLVPQKWRQNIHGFVFMDDIIPRVSIGSCRELVSWLLCLREYREKTGVNNEAQIANLFLPLEQQALIAAMTEGIESSVKQHEWDKKMKNAGHGDSLSEKFNSTMDAMESTAKLVPDLMSKFDKSMGVGAATEKVANQAMSKWNNLFGGSTKKAEDDVKAKVDEVATSVESVAISTNATSETDLPSSPTKGKIYIAEHKERIAKHLAEECEMWIKMVSEDEPKVPRPGIDDEKLKHPGSVFYMYPVDAKKFDMWSDEAVMSTQGVTMERSNSKTMEKMITSNRCFTDHLPAMYEWGLERVVWTIEGDESIRLESHNIKERTEKTLQKKAAQTEKSIMGKFKSWF